jgi:hypothetical protein
MSESPESMRQSAARLRNEADRYDERASALRKDADLLERDARRVEMERNAAIPVDRSARQLSGGGKVTADHRELKDNGQQKGYVVLTPEERAKGFVRPVRRSYVHLKCGAATRMSQDIAETYARDPYFYSGTFCTTCGGHFPVGEDGEFVWLDDREQKVGT